MTVVAVRRLGPVVLAGVTAIVSLGLFALAVAFDWLGADVGRGAQFCEVSDGPLNQPVNTLSNLGFVAAGLAIAVRAGRPGGLGRSTMSERPGLATAYACLVVLLGPASMAMHGTGTALGGDLDMLSMYLVAAFAASYAAMRLWRRGPVFLAVAYAGALATCELVGLYDRPIPVVEFAGNVAFGVLLVVAMVLERRHAARNAVTLDLRWLAAAVGSLALAFAVWNTAKTGAFGCFPHSVYQGHGVWHLLCAVSAYCLFRLYVSEAPAGDAARRSRAAGPGPSHRSSAPRAPAGSRRTGAPPRHGSGVNGTPVS